MIISIAEDLYVEDEPSYNLNIFEKVNKLIVKLCGKNGYMSICIPRVSMTLRVCLF